MPPEVLQQPATNATRTRRLSAFLAVSLAAHLALVAFFPDYYRDFVPSVPSVFEVSLLEPEPQPVAAPQPEPAPSPQPEPERNPSQDVAKAAAEPRAPVLALPKPKPEPVLEGSFAVAPPRLPEPSPAVADPNVQAASVQVTPPSFDAAYLSNPPPQYPQAARRASEQGTVMLRVLVKRDGLPARVEVEKSSGSAGLDAAARDTVWGWRFVPARQGDDPVESWVLVPVVFRLEGPG
jgi:protein TonB